MALYEMEDAKERVILVGVQENDAEPEEESLDELAELARTAGAEVAGRLIQKREAMHPVTYIGKGKILELKELLWETDATGIICDDELTSVQLNHLEEELECKIVDRTLLILDIFAGRAVSREGKIQVELAQLKYRAARLVGLRNSLSRLGGRNRNKRTGREKTGDGPPFDPGEDQPPEKRTPGSGRTQREASYSEKTLQSEGGGAGGIYVSRKEQPGKCAHRSRCFRGCDAVFHAGYDDTFSETGRYTGNPAQ